MTHLPCFALLRVGRNLNHCIWSATDQSLKHVLDRLKLTDQVVSSDSDTDGQLSPEDDKLIDEAKSTDNTSTSLSLNELTESFTGLRIERTKGKHVTEPQFSGRNKGRSSPAVSRAESSDDEEEAYENCEFLNSGM